MVFSMTTNSFLKNIPAFLLYVLSFFLLLFPTLSIICIILLLLFVMVQEKIMVLSNILKSSISVILLLFYLWHALGMIWSSNLDYGFKDLETKLSFIVFPLIFSSLLISEEIRKNTLIAFMAGCFVTCIFSLINAENNYINDADITHFFYNDLGNSIHPTYFSIYITIAILISLSFTKWKGTCITLTIAMCLIQLFFLAFLAMLSSRMATFTAFIVCTYYLFFHFVKDKLISMEIVIYMEK